MVKGLSDSPFFSWAWGVSFWHIGLGKNGENESCGLLMAAGSCHLAVCNYASPEHSHVYQWDVFDSDYDFVLVEYALECGKNVPGWIFVGYIFTAALCCYNHYFSMLLAGIIGLTGLLFIQKNNRNTYLAANMLVLLLFLPHIPVLLHQLDMKGIGGWLAKT